MLNEHHPIFHCMRYHFMLTYYPPNNRKGLLIGFKPAVQSFFDKILFN